MFDPVHVSDTADNLRSLRAAHQDQEENLHYLTRLLEDIQLRFVRLNNGLADFQTNFAGLDRDRAALPVSRRAARPVKPSRLPSAMLRTPRPEAAGSRA